MMTARFLLSPNFRIKKKSDFARLQKSAGKIYAKHFLLIIGPSESGSSRVGLTITKKVDPRAVARNRLKRRLREFFRHIKAELIAPLDIVIVARQGAPELTSAALKSELIAALKAHKLLRPQG